MIVAAFLTSLAMVILSLVGKNPFALAISCHFCCCYDYIALCLGTERNGLRTIGRHAWNTDLARTRISVSLRHRESPQRAAPFPQLPSLHKVYVDVLIGRPMVLEVVHA